MWLASFIYLVNGDGPFSGLVEEFLVVPVGVGCLELPRPVVVIAEPDDAPRQQERVLVASWIPDPCSTETTVNRQMRTLYLIVLAGLTFVIKS